MSSVGKRQRGRFLTLVLEIICDLAEIHVILDHRMYFNSKYTWFKGVHHLFINDAVSMIKDMLVEWQRVAMQGEIHDRETEPELSLYDRIRRQNTKDH